MPVLAVVNRRPEAPTLRIGVLGCADIAWRRSLPAMVVNPSVRPVAVASRDAGRAARFARRFGCAGLVGYDALLDRDDVDAVYLPLPPGLHAAWADRALGAGKHVLVEKPLAVSHPEAEALLAAARERRLVLLENVAFLHHGQHSVVRDLVRGGEVGTVRAMSSAFGFPPRPAPDIRYRRDLGGGALLDVGIYPLRAALFFLGPELEVVGSVLRMDRELGVDVSGAALLSTPDGVTAEVSFGFENSYRCEYEIWGSAGRVQVRRAFTTPPGFPPVVTVERQDARARRLPIPPEDQFSNVFTNFARVVRSGAGLDGEHAGALRQAALLDVIRDRARLVFA
ncbi:MAG TPA: Gfo/Idh/MocA family oxidoreductase [Micromonosporaceae bacterium]|nr:Gfo/Idh/MocA family oxidoreductase [Micromonosporaceae bacterium]